MINSINCSSSLPLRLDSTQLKQSFPSITFLIVVPPLVNTWTYSVFLKLNQLIPSCQIDVIVMFMLTVYLKVSLT